MRKRRRFTWGGDGCGFLLLSCFLSGCLLLMNGALVKAASDYLTNSQPQTFVEDAWTMNIVGFTVPLLMLVAQWRLVDLFADMFAGPGRSEPPGLKNSRGGLRSKLQRLFHRKRRL